MNKILIVEDEAVVARDIGQYLKQLNYEPLATTAMGEESLLLAERLRPDLVLMDIHLAGDMDGIIAAQAIRERFDIPVVFLTAFAGDGSVQRAKITEPFGFIIKPFEERDLRIAISMALYKHQADKEIRTANQQLRANEERFNQLAKQSRTGFWKVNTDGIYTYCSQVFSDLTGYPLEEIVGQKHYYDIHPERGREDFMIAQLDVAARKDFFRELEHPIQTKDGRIIWVSANGIPVLDNDGKLLGYHGSDTDITEFKRAQAEKEKLEVQNRQLQKSESLGRMAGAIAHHFNNQLQAVMMNLELAMNDLPRNTGSFENLTKAMDSALKAGEVSGLMLTYLGQTHCNRQPLDLSEVCIRSLPILRAAIPKGLTLVTELPSHGPTISANANQIQQVLTNLVTNAWEASQEGRGAIRLTVKSVSAVDIAAVNRFPIEGQPQENTYACLEVVDSCSGIRPQDIEKLFEPFFSTKFNGRGLGLSVVLGIVRAHSGVVTVESEMGRGSAFRVFLPLSTEAVPRKLVPVVQAQKTAACGTVMVVDDEPSVREVLTAMIEVMGFRVFSAKDGLEAVEVFRQHKDEIRLVLCDVCMPGMDGWQTLAALRQLAPDIPVILCSGYSEAQVMVEDHSEQPQAFLSKPCVFATFRQTIFQVLARKERQ